jgi:RecA/RadA recombinase
MRTPIKEKSSNSINGYDKKRLESFNIVVDKLKGWTPARDSLAVIRSVPTIFPQINVGTRIGGWPLQRICLIHGPSNNGKTAAALGLGLSFLKAGHFFGFVDAERTTPRPWVQNLMGKWLNHPGFIVHEPDTYESTVDSIRELAEHVSKSRADGVIADNVSLLIVVDSIRKLVPKRLLEKILKEGAESKKGSIDGMGGRAAMYKAALNSAWMDELTSLMYSTNSSIVFIGRESENTNMANPNSPTWRLTGGKGLIFDSSLIIRVTREKWLKSGVSEKSKVVGERHCASIHKTKVGGKDDRVTNCYFHTSNGVLIPEGFDRARDVIDLGKRCGLIKVRGSWLEVTSTGETWQGENKAVKALASNPAELHILESEVLDICKPEILEIESND